MDVKVTLFLVVLLVFTIVYQADADFGYNRLTPLKMELRSLHLKCIPGRTVIKVTEPPVEMQQLVFDDDEDRRRTHMVFKSDDEFCQMCVCSVEGKDEYCSNRPAKNVNECIRMSDIVEDFKQNKPFEHDSSLSFRIRRDYLWHNDEIPYEAKAKCRRGHAYYTNSINAKDTDIDVDSELESLLDYSNKEVCYYCVCGVEGSSVGCIARKAWYCQFYRNMRSPDSARDRYRGIFQQDRPSYFRQLSYRLRRTMDGGMFDLMDTVGTGKDNENCIPFVSEYTDCTEENLCDGCVKCTCNAQSSWVCQDIKQCKPGQGDESTIEEDDIDQALDAMLIEMKENDDQKRLQSNTPLVPRPGTVDFNDVPHMTNHANKELLLAEREVTVEDEILQLMREKRAALIDADNDTVKFYHTKDDINIDTLKHLNLSGTLKAKKFDGNLQSRRSGLSHNTTNNLKIEYSQPKIYNHHITDNKIDTIPHEEKRDPLIQERLSGFVGNHTQEEKNYNLSKLVVSELAIGHEVIGDHDAPVISNITFLEQNETLTAMALIAGNLLNKLWHMEKDATGDAIDIEMLRHEKISDLLELFKEPLNIKQQQFLKNALQQLSSALDKHKNIEEISLCENVEELKKAEVQKPAKDCDKHKKVVNKVEVNPKLNNVLDLVKKYETLQSKLNILKSGIPKDTVDKIVTKDEQVYLNNYGQILETITKMLVPKSSTKKIMNGIQNTNPLVNDEALRRKLKDLYNIDLGNMNITAKDKIVLDYLTHIQSRPDCLFKKQKPFVTPNIEGNILLNLSEFFKIKSLTELFNKLGVTETTDKSILEGENIVPKTDDLLSIPVQTTTTTTTTTTTIKSIIPPVTEKDIHLRTETKNNFKTTKDKLKEHLKAILEDIMELQKGAGQMVDGKNVKVADALPCIYKLLMTSNSGDTVKQDNSKPTTEASIVYPTKKMQEIFETLKNDLKLAQTRRTSSYTGSRPKSAVIWERIVRNQGEKKMNTRRSFDTLPKSLEQIRKIINQAENGGSNTYKNYALLYEVPAADRYLLLKTFESDVNTYMDILQSIKGTIDTMNTLPSADYTDIKNFIDNAAININLNERIVKNIDKPKSKEPSIRDSVIKVSTTRHNKTKPVARFAKVSNANQNTNSNRNIDTVNYKKIEIYENMDPYKTVNRLASNVYNNRNGNSAKLTREQLITQLIKNRIQHYLKVRETEANPENDINYDIAKKILQHLDLGNYNLAKELYKIFAEHKHKALAEDGEPSTTYIEKPQSFYGVHTQFNKQPLIQFDDIKEKESLLNKDQVIKQLLSLRNTKI